MKKLLFIAVLGLFMVGIGAGCNSSTTSAPATTTTKKMEEKKETK